MSVRIKIKPLLWLAMLLMLVGCNGKLSLIKDSFRFYNSEVSFPDQMLLIENGDTSTVAMPKIDKPMLVRFYGSYECSDCALNHMRDNVRLEKYSKKNGLFDFIVILAPPTEESESIINKAIGMSLPLRIYVDSSHYYESEGIIPKSEATHTFMIDTHYTPFYLGNPLRSTKDKEHFEKYLTKYLTLHNQSY
jgi:hypothetical protein